MTLRVAIQTDPLETAAVESNTTFALAEAAQKIGAELFECHGNKVHATS